MEEFSRNGRQPFDIDRFVDDIHHAALSRGGHLIDE